MHIGTLTGVSFFVFLVWIGINPLISTSGAQLSNFRSRSQPIVFLSLDYQEARTRAFLRLLDGRHTLALYPAARTRL